MNTACREETQLMISYLKEELSPLERTRFEGHVEHCARCSALKNKLARSLETAATWSPEVSPEHFERLVDRLSPYLESRAPRRFAYAAAGLIAAAAAITFVALRPREAGDSPIATSSPAPFVRLVSSGDWDGRVNKAAENKLQIAMSRGFAVIDFEGGEDRAIAVNAPGVVVEAIGTRFFVESGERTLIGVSEGSVRVKAADRIDRIEAGETRAYSLRGEPVQAERAARSLAQITHPFLDRARTPVAGTNKTAEKQAQNAIIAEHSGASAQDEAPAPNAAREERSERREAAAPSAAALKELARAEAFARRGRHEAAVQVYRRITVSNDPELVPYRDLARYEMARLQAFVMNRRELAEPVLRALSRSPESEVATQARFALCELDLKSSPCASASCLRGLRETGAASVAEEAAQLLERWGLEKISCADQKTPARDRPTE